ncbi:hypothetical protein VNO78_20498 [Psophocarpus tetragonolobus]|uniref:Uncharacterized protein n=1 Tax=Psophocarpus tetragonolobus TaxID=3891 RepID=A0AAN9SAG5_PSOTE
MDNECKYPTIMQLSLDFGTVGFMSDELTLGSAPYLPILHIMNHDDGRFVALKSSVPRDMRFHFGQVSSTVGWKKVRGKYYDKKVSEKIRDQAKQVHVSCLLQQNSRTGVGLGWEKRLKKKQMQVIQKQPKRKWNISLGGLHDFHS